MAGLRKLVESIGVPEREFYVFMELAVFGLAEFEILSKDVVESKWVFKDLLTGGIRDEDMQGLFN